MKIARIILAGTVTLTVSSAVFAQQALTGTVTKVDRINRTIAIQPTQSDTVGAAWSSESTTRKPFFKVCCSIGIFTSCAEAIPTAAIVSVRASSAVKKILRRFMLCSGQTYFSLVLYPISIDARRHQ